MVMTTKSKAEDGTVLKMLRFGILGSGNAAGFHANALASVKNAVLTGIADRDYGRAVAFAEKYGAKSYSSLEAMLKDDEIDVVCICTPSGFHADQAIEVLRSGKHVVLEKPMALTVEDADMVIAEVERSDKLLTVVFQNRFVPDVQKAKETVESGALGKLIFCDLSMKYWRDPDYYASSDWRGTFKYDGGGALINQGIHGVDMLLYIVGDAKVRFAEVKTSFHNIETEDTAVAVLDFENGATGTLHASTCAYPGFNRRIEIIGTKGCIIMSEGHIEKMVIDGKVIIDEAVEKRGASGDHTIMDTTFHAMQLQNLVDAAEGMTPLFIDGREGRRALKLIKDVYSFRDR